MDKFNACGPGIIVPQPLADTHSLYTDWNAKRKWCEEQCWENCEDFLVSATLNGTKWYFKTEAYQTLFILRWG